MFYLIEPDTNKFIVDVAREEANSLSYAALEKLKSGVWNIYKYEGKKAKYKNRQVIVAINEFPDRTKLSRDRYEVYRKSVKKGKRFNKIFIFAKLKFSTP
jgi:hypothetical protein